MKVEFSLWDLDLANGSKLTMVAKEKKTLSNFLWNLELSLFKITRILGIYDAIARNKSQIWRLQEFWNSKCEDTCMRKKYAIQNQVEYIRFKAEMFGQNLKYEQHDRVI